MARFFTTGGGAEQPPSGVPAGSAVMSDSLLLFADVTVAEVLAAKTDTPTFDLVATYAETQGLPVDTVTQQAQLALADSSASPTDRRTFEPVVGATTVTQTVGTGWTTPANAQGLVDGTLVVMNSPAGATSAPKSGTLIGTYASVGTVATETQTGTVALTFTYSATIGVLASGSLQFAYSLNGGGVFTNAGPAITATTATTTQTVQVTLPIASLSQLQFRAVANTLNSVTAAATFNLDAVTATFTFT